MSVAAAITDAVSTVWRRRTPTVLQMEAVECGAAALAIVLAHYGRFLPLEQLRSDCGVSRDGSKAVNILKAARTHGMTAKAFAKSPEALKSLPLPVIVHWDMNHFLVVERFYGDKVDINDPATGPRTITWREFDECFSGVVLVFEKGPEFKPGGTSPRVWPGIRSRIRGGHNFIWFLALGGFATIFPGLALPVFSRVFVDDYLVRGLSGWVKPLLVGMLLTALIRAALTWIESFYLIRANIRVAVTENARFMWHLLRLPLEFFGQRYVGDIIQRAAVNDTIADIISNEISSLLVSGVSMFFFGALLFAYDVSLTLIGIANLVVNLAFIKFTTRYMTDSNRRIEMEGGKLTGMTISALNGIETLKANGTDEHYFQKIAGQQAKIVVANQSLAWASAQLSVVPTFFSGLSDAAILIVGGFRIMHGDMSIGTFVAFQTLMASFSGTVSYLVDFASSIQQFKGSLNRVDDVLDYKVDPQFTALPAPQAAGDGRAAPAATAAAIEPIQGRLELVGVTFGYSRLDPPLLKEFSLTVEPGQRIAVVGRSGCGKSTLAKLVTGQYQPWDGRVLIDGRPRADYPREALALAVGYVDQNITLFEGTIRENLTMWDPSISDITITEAAMDAAIHDDIAGRPAGYHGVMAEAGGNFSGGQRQRLEIARCLTAEPRLLVLDEATSALDTLTEERIDAALRRRGCTCLIIAHRLSTIRDCDEIVVLEKGTIVERGTHEELMKLGGQYFRMQDD